MKPDTQQVFIVGQHRFQNEIMAALISKTSGYPCAVKPRLADVPVRSAPSARCRNLVMLDCAGGNVESLCVTLQHEASAHLTNEFVALFNVVKNSSVEKAALTCGVRGLFFENDAGGSLCRGIQAILNGELWMTRKVRSECPFEIEKNKPRKKPAALLTARETEILTLLVSGSTNVLIANRLCVSQHTVKTHIYNIFKKINVSNRLQAALWATKNL